MAEILITSSNSPDLDGFACIMAYVEFLRGRGQEAMPGVFGQPSEEVEFVLNRFGWKLPEPAPNPESFDRVILVDESILSGLSERIAPEKVVEVIDHRKINQVHLFPNAKAQVELVGACATLLAEKFKQNEVVISDKSALLLQAAIISNTLNFQSGATTERDKSAAYWLNEKAVLPAHFAREMFLAKSDLTGRKLQEVMKNEFGIFQKDVQGKKLGIAQIEMLGAEKLANSRKREILQELAMLKAKFELNLIFLSILDLEKRFNLFITSDEQAQDLLHSVLGVEFQNDIAKRPDLILRKELWPLLRDKIN